MVLTLEQAQLFLEEDGKFKRLAHGYEVFTCELCGCVVELFYIDVHRIKCHPIRLNYEKKFKSDTKRN